MRLHLVRHGVTAHTSQRLFSGGLEGKNPPLSEEGHEQAALTASWLAAQLSEIVLVSSPVLRTLETAAHIAAAFGVEMTEDPRFAEMNFGGWEAKSFSDLFASKDPDIQAWFGDLGYAAGGTGESFLTVEKRVLAARDDLLATYADRTVVVVSHVTPIKVLVANAMDAPLHSIFRLELEPASVTTINFHPEGSRAHATLQRFNALPDSRAATYR